MPIDDSLTITKELLETDETIPDWMSLSPKNILDFLELLLRTTFIIFHCTYYEQTEGVVTGGPPSSIFAEIYMKGTETTALTTTSHPPKVWECYVYDVFSFIRKSNPHDFFEHISSLHPKTKFIMETEENSQLPFLGTLIQRNSDNTIPVRVYRKPPHTETNTTSHHLPKAKKIVITSLFDRAKTSIATISTKNKEETHLAAVLQAIGYPKKLIKNTIRTSQLPRQSANKKILKIKKKRHQ